jgi:hypothetical protein
LLRANHAIDPDLNVYESIDIEGDRIHNYGVSLVGAITSNAVSRGSDGLFVALCSSDAIVVVLSGNGTGAGATLPPGELVRVPGLDEPRDGPDCQ